MNPVQTQDSVNESGSNAGAHVLMNPVQNAGARVNESGSKRRNTC